MSQSLILCKEIQRRPHHVVRLLSAVDPMQSLCENENVPGCGDRLRVIHVLWDITGP